MKKLVIVSVLLLNLVSQKLYAQKIEINPFGFCDDIKGYEYKDAVLKPDSVIDLGIGNEYIKIPTLKIDSLKLEQFKNLKILRIGNFYLDILNVKDLGKLNLLVLKISKCRIKEIPIGIFKNKHLEFLAINDNQLTSIPKDVGKLKQLKRLILIENQIANLPYKQLKKLKYLIEFNVWDNPVVENESQAKKLNKLYKIIDNHRVQQGIPKLYTVEPTNE